jgi:hypothetical protein
MLEIERLILMLFHADVVETGNLLVLLSDSH